MTLTFTNRGKRTIADTAISSSTDFRCGVFTNASVPSAATIQDMNFVSDLLTSGTGPATEAANSGYSRQDLAGVTVTEDDTGNVVTIVATAPQITPAAGGVWAGVFFYIEGASDAARTLIAVDVPAATFTPDGNPVTLPQLNWTLS